MIVGEDLPIEEREQMEYQARVDGGLWRSFRKAQPDGTITFDDAHLILPGEHEIEVRARYADRYTSLDPSASKIRAIVDPNPPTIEAKLDGDFAAIRVIDRETPLDEPLFLQASTGGDSWFDVELTRIVGDQDGACSAKIAYAALGNVQKLELRALDPRGNQSPIAMLRLGLTSQDTIASESEGGCACHEAPVAHAHGDGLVLGIALLVFVLFLGLRRRRPE
jgi:MYXO-CTERM domain-containing protein